MAGTHSSPSLSTSSPSSSTRWSLLPNSSLQPSNSASSFFSVSFSTQQRPSHRRFFPCFLMTSSPPSPLRPRPASSAASFSSDAVLCCRHGLVVAVSLHWSLLRVRLLPPSPLPRLSSILLSRMPVVRCLLSPPSPPLPLFSITVTVEKTASTSFAAGFLPRHQSVSLKILSPDFSSISLIFFKIFLIFWGGFFDFQLRGSRIGRCMYMAEKGEGPSPRPSSTTTCLLADSGRGPAVSWWWSALGRGCCSSRQMPTSSSNNSAMLCSHHSPAWRSSWRALLGCLTAPCS